MPNKTVAFAALSMLIAIGLGAFGAHGLKEIVSSAQLESFKTGVLYHLLHSLAILGIAIYATQTSQNLKWVTRMLFIGILLFSGSIYLLATKDLLGMSGAGKVLGPITPLGGLSFMIGWVILTIKSLRKQQ